MMKIEFLIIFFLFFILSIFEQKLNKKKIMWIQIIILTYLVGIRKNTPDLEFYEMIYNYKLKDGIDLGYNILQNLFIFFNLNFLWFKIFIGFTSIFLIVTSIYTISREPILTTFIYYSLIFLEKPYIQMRNGLSIGFFLLGVRFFLFKKSYFKSFCMFLVSGSIHFTGYLYIFIQFVEKIIRKKKIVAVICILLSILFIRLDYSVLLSLSNYKLGVFTQKLKLYLFSENGQKQFIETKFGFSGIISIILYILYVITYKYNSEKKSLFLLLGGGSIIFRLAAYNLTPLNRVVGIFSIVDPFIYASFYNLKYKNKEIKIVYLVFLYICIFIYCYIVLKNSIKILKI